jgi:hypothetical protein
VVADPVPPALDLDSVARMIARATPYARNTFMDGIQEPDPARRSAYNLIVYGAPQLLVEARRLAAERDALQRENAELRAASLHKLIGLVPSGKLRDLLAEWIAAEQPREGAGSNA